MGTTDTDPTAPAADVDDQVDDAILEDIERRYRRHILLRLVALGAGTLLLAAFGIVAAGMGSAEISPVEVLHGVLGSVFTWELSAYSERTAMIVMDLRLPRILLATLAGAALAVAGVIMQGLLRNLLVSPFTLGISSAAALGASVAIVLGVTATGAGAYAMMSSALVAALCCAAVVFSLAWFREMRAETVILVGVALGYLFSAMTATLQLIGTDEQIAAIVRWTFGSFNSATWREVVIVSILLLVLLPVVSLQARSLNALAFGGDDVARGLGVNVPMLRLTAGIISVVLAAVVVSITGVIGFVGLVAPHIARLIIGGDHRYLLPFSVLIGGLLLVTADTTGRTLFAPVVVPVGIVVAYLGVPLFLHLVLSRRRKYF